VTTEAETTGDDPLAELRARADALERLLGDVRKEAESRLTRAELKAEAIRAGMIDLDGLKLLDQSAIKLTPGGDVEGIVPLMAQLKRDKPWLFVGASSSSPVTPPPAQPPRQKRATEMTDAEYRAARAELLKRRY
jgi:hypothetical protein